MNELVKLLNDLEKKYKVSISIKPIFRSLPPISITRVQRDDDEKHGIHFQWLDQQPTGIMAECVITDLEQMLEDARKIADLWAN